MGIIKNKKSKEVFNLLETILRRFKGLFFFRLTFYCKRQNNQNKVLKSIKKPPARPLVYFQSFSFLFFCFSFLDFFLKGLFGDFNQIKTENKTKLGRTRYCLKTLKRFKYFSHSASLIKTGVNDLKKQIL